MQFSYKIRFFRPEEFLCPCCHTGQPAQMLVLSLDWLRRGFGAPLLINSGVRCPAHNAAVGGAPNSRHLIGCAADVRPADRARLTEFKSLVRRVTEPLQGWEIIDYPTFVHIGVPRAAAQHRWNGKAILRGTFTMDPPIAA